jgi:hypothetical protein
VKQVQDDAVELLRMPPGHRGNFTVKEKGSLSPFIDSEPRPDYSMDMFGR